METATDRLKKMAAWDTEPVLTETEIANLLEQCALADAAGFTPQDETWTPTYDLNAAASAAWLIKAGRAAALVEVEPPGSGLTTSRVFENCLRMSRMYSGRATMTLGMSG